MTLVIAAAASRASTLSDTGPLSLGAGDGVLCLLPGAGSDYTYGGETVRNTGRHDAVITDVTLVASRAVRMPEVYVAQISNRTLVGNLTTWPPTIPEGSRTWATRTPAVGSTIRPGAENTANLVVHLRTEGPEAGFAAVQVEYQAGGKKYVARTTNTVAIRSRC